MEFSLSPQIAEIIGVIIGDGSIRYKPKINQYYIEIVGDVNKEKKYFNYLEKQIKNNLI